jgi:hypothetical protein
MKGMKIVPIILVLILTSSLLVPKYRPATAAEKPDKDDVEFWMALGAGFFSALACVLTWFFGGCLEVSLYIHLAGVHVANDITASNYISDSMYACSVIPSDLTLSRSQTDSPDFSESLNQMGNEAINTLLNATGLTLALATATHRFYTAQEYGDSASMTKQRTDIHSFHTELELVEATATGKLMTFAAALSSEGPDPIATKQNFIDFQNIVSVSGFPEEEVDLLNLLVSQCDPLIFDGFSYLDYLENMAISIECPHSELSASNATREAADVVQYTSEVIGPFPLGPVGGILVPVDRFGLLAPYIGFASTILVATVATAIYVKRVKHKKEE